MLQRRFEEELLVGLLDWERLDSIAEEGISLHHVEMQVVDDAVGTHRIIAES